MTQSQTTSRKTKLSVQYMTRIGVLAALAIVLFQIQIPVVAFYQLDFSNLPVLLGAFSMGPIPGLIILAIKAAICCLNTHTAMIGELADFIMGAAFILPAALIYRHKKNRKDAVVGMVVGTLCMIVAGCLTNAFILIPFYINAFGMPMEAIIGMGTAVLPFVDTELKLILCITAPFNLLKGAVLCLLTYLLYKRLSPLLHVRK